MDKFTKPRNLKAMYHAWAASIAKAIKIESRLSKPEFAPYTHCPNCKSQIIVSLNSSNPLDLNWKRHFCSDPDRLAHEVGCVTQLQNIIEYYNRRELSSFQLGLKMDD
jgi:hypothetical protein